MSMTFATHKLTSSSNHQWVTIVYLNVKIITQCRDLWIKKGIFEYLLFVLAWRIRGGVITLHVFNHVIFKLYFWKHIAPNKNRLISKMHTNTIIQGQKILHLLSPFYIKGNCRTSIFLLELQAVQRIKPFFVPKRLQTAALRATAEDYGIFVCYLHVSFTRHFLLLGFLVHRLLIFIQ